MSFLSKTSAQDFEWLVDQCSKYVSIDKNLAIQTVKNQTKFIQGKEHLAQNNQIKRLEDIWYRSLKNKPDYSVYNDPYYVCDIWCCWSI